MNLQKRSAGSSFVAFHLLVLVFLLLITTVSARLVIQEEYLFNDGEGTTTTKVWKDINKAFEGYKHNLGGIKDSVGKGIKQGLNLGNNKAGGDWGILTHEDFPNYDIRLKEPKLCDPSVRQYSGYLDAGEKKHFFFWFFESRNDPANDPIVLWLNGGPGCSSLTGLFFELGPCIVNAEGTDTILNPYSWNNNATVIFLDQPMNVGYSHGTGVSDTLAAAKDVYAFLQIFFKRFPQYAELDFHIAGESYAGHYIPAIASEIHENNKGTSAWIQSTKPKHLRHVNLESILIGNGLVDPLVQYKYYPEMACDSSYGPVLDEAACDKMRNAYKTCSRLINNCYNSQNVFNCFPASLYCNREIIGPYQETGKNPYDVRKECKGNSLCYPILSAIEAYLNNETIKNELGAEVEEYKTCNMEINFRFQIAGDWMRPYHRSIPPLLKDDIRVLIYAGDADFMCNWFGNRAWVEELEWHGKEGYNEALVRDWILEDGSDEIAGTVQSYEGLAFLRIYEAGHMVPYDQPNASLDFFNRWIQKRNL